LKRFITFLLFVLFIFSNIQAINPLKVDSLKVGDHIPPLVFKTDGKKVLTSDNLKGKTALLVFFATWCGPCRAELPAIEKKIWQKQKNNKSFMLITIGREHSLAELLKFKKDNKFTFPMVPDSGRIIYSQFAPQLIPRTYLINKNGKIIRSIIGFNKEEFEETVKVLEEELRK
jgi:peroxiredoxin